MERNHRPLKYYLLTLHCYGTLKVYIWTYVEGVQLIAFQFQEIFQL